MTAIHFFTPITYDVTEKTTLQKMVESVDEYFYLGSGQRVTILDPEDIQNLPEARDNLANRYRSCANVALKIASYCTIIIPLIALLAKVILRHIAQIHSIYIVKPTSLIQKKLYTDTLTSIIPFLSHHDRGQWAQSACFVRDAAHKQDQSDAAKIAKLKKEIEALPPGKIPEPDFQRLLIDLLLSPIIGHPKHWTPLMDKLMEHYQFSKTIAGFIHDHANIAKLLKSADREINPNQMAALCSYIGTKLMKEVTPWVAYRAFEQYMGIHRPCVEKALKEHLASKADRHLKSYPNGIKLHDLNNPTISQTFTFQEADIDPRVWFGHNNENHSLLLDPAQENGDAVRMPELLREVLWTHIQKLQAASSDCPLLIGMTGRAEAQLPGDFTLELAQRITDAHIFIETFNTINTDALQNTFYAQPIGRLSDKQLAILAQEYPKATGIFRNHEEWRKYWNSKSRA